MPSIAGPATSQPRRRLSSRSGSSDCQHAQQLAEADSAGVPRVCRSLPTAEGYRQVHLPPSAESAWGLSWSPAGARVWVAPPASAERLSSRPLGGQARVRKGAMTSIYVPISSPDQWKSLLAEPEKQWRTGFSVRTIAHSWLASDGIPTELRSLFATSELHALRRIQPLLILPEHQVALPPTSGHPSQNDVFVLARADDGGLLSLTVEGKVSESFDRAVADWMKPPSAGKKERLSFLSEKLGLSAEVPGHIRYQLLHRTVSAIIEAERFGARYAAMVVHSFSPTDEWFDDYAAFLGLFGTNAQVGKLATLQQLGQITLLAGWARGDPRFLAA